MHACAMIKDGKPSPWRRHILGSPGHGSPRALLPRPVIGTLSRLRAVGLPEHGSPWVGTPRLVHHAMAVYLLAALGSLIGTMSRFQGGGPPAGIGSPFHGVSTVVPPPASRSPRQLVDRSQRRVGIHPMATRLMAVHAWMAILGWHSIFRIWSTIPWRSFSCRPC